MGWGALRVINEDRIAPEYRLRYGTAIAIWKSLPTSCPARWNTRTAWATAAVIGRGEVQRMTAGKGILHSEANPLADQETHLLQIWIEPAQHGTPASYEQQALPEDEMRGRWRLVASPDGAEGSTTIGQDARLWASILAPGERLDYRLAPGRLAYVQIVYGRLEINGKTMAAGDGAKIAEETGLEFVAGEEVEFLLFDLPPVV
jgi:redox-sensitive bicupin YhaK (pirin superfamily)